ncbi:E3 ubiquitin-protein ligase UPL4-like [Papaver somniferum]|uniref:E3 ubiquitin-protein ligase UPL4-like n=1 Tax=Papaver somniferum TaxID=3469 RepID=UPI000E6F84F7|nr:E3 ubiquitin-protein ligase UPL4-like [Papaver somniferum]
MENLGKRESTDQLQSPVDKRTCSSSEESSKPDSSSVSPASALQTHTDPTSTNQQQLEDEDTLMDEAAELEATSTTPATTSVSGSSESPASSLQTHLDSTSIQQQQDDEDALMEEPAELKDDDEENEDDGSEEEEEYGEEDNGFYDSEGDGNGNDLNEIERVYQENSERRNPGDRETFRTVLRSLSDVNNDVSEQLSSLTELCDVLSFCTESSLSGSTASALSPLLVRLARHDTNPDIMLFSIRAITYLIDALPASSGYLVRDNVVPALCERLMVIEYLDVAEQCLLALEKISADQPDVCLRAGAIMAVLNFIDFFSSNVQRVAISTVINVCKKLSSDTWPLFMDAVPVLCNLLQYEDQKLVANVVTCLLRITETVSNSLKMVDQICEHRLIQQVIPLISSGKETSFNQSIYGLLSRLASGSANAVKILLEQKISCTLKNILSSYVGDANSNQVYEVLRLLNVLLPPVGVKTSSSKEKVLMDQPELLRRFGVDIVPTLVEVVNGGASLQVCEGCVCVINKLVNVSRSDILSDILDSTNISSFLAGVFARKDHHVLVSALNIVQTILKELPDMFLKPFAKEGVVYAIDRILAPEKFTQSSSSQQKLSVNSGVRCLCYNLNMAKPRSSELGKCKLEKESVRNLAKQIKETYFSMESQSSEIGLTETLQKLRKYSATLNDMVDANEDSCLEDTLGQIMMELSDGDSVSTFEFIESGIVKSLLNYFSKSQYLKEKVVEHRGLSDYSHVIMKRFATFASFSLPSTSLQSEGIPLAILVRRLQVALSTLENFPVILNQTSKPRAVYAAIPNKHTTHPCLRVQFVNEEGETDLCYDSLDAVNIEPFTSFDAIERYLWSQISVRRNDAQTTYIEGESEDDSMEPESEDDFMDVEEQSSPEVNDIAGEDDSMKPEEQSSPEVNDIAGKLEDDSMETKEQSFPEADGIAGESEDNSRKSEEEQSSPEVNATPKMQNSVDESSSCIASASIEEHGSGGVDDCHQKLKFSLDGRELDLRLTLYQAILQLQVKEQNDMVADKNFWSAVYNITFKKDVEVKESTTEESTTDDCLVETQISTAQDYPGKFYQNLLCLSGMLTVQLPYDLEKSDPVYEILFLLKILEVINMSSCNLISHERVKAFTKGKSDDLDSLAVTVIPVPLSEFVSSKLTEKLEQQMVNPSAVCAGAMPSWCSQLMAECPFLFSFEARNKYFLLTALRSQPAQSHSSSASSNDNSSDRRSLVGNLPRKKFRIDRTDILSSAAQMMDAHAHKRITLEAEYDDEVGTGLGPTLEFYTLVSHEFQKLGMGMWREDRSFPSSEKNVEPGFVVAPSGLFPRPWSDSMESSNGVEFPEVLKRFVLLGKVVAKALQDGRVMDLPLSKAFYKLALDQDLNIHDIQSLDPAFGRVLVEFQALVDRNRISSPISALYVRNTKIDDLCLDFTLPGYPDYLLSSSEDHRMVNTANLEKYVSLIVDATLNSGVLRQVDAFKSGFNQVFPLTSLQAFSAEEIDRLLCGEQDAWTSRELLDHIKFDHGYTVTSPPIIYLLEIMKDMQRDHQQAFVQFVTGAPRLPHGGLASLNPKMTIVRKHADELADGELPSVMTCANYLKLPPYSTKDIMKEKLLYAITEGQGSFHLS